MKVTSHDASKSSDGFVTRGKEKRIGIADQYQFPLRSAYCHIRKPVACILVIEPSNLVLPSVYQVPEYYVRL
jgi:hypothetical protein